MNKKIGLHWFRKDLRLKDNPSLATIAKCVDELICVYVLPETAAVNKPFSLSKDEKLGEHRTHFIYQCLRDLNNSLKQKNQRLYIVQSNNKSVLLELIDKYKVTHVSAEWYCGTNERHQWTELQEQRPKVDFIQANASTLYLQEQFPFSIEHLPSTFSPFRKKVEKHCQVTCPAPAVDALPPTLRSIDDNSFLSSSSLEVADTSDSKLNGGETNALKQLNYYLWDSDSIASYKSTRNGLDGWDYSSKLSAWLAQGCLSPRQVAKEITQYEAKRIKNESTYWLFFELLWREFFHWYHLKHGTVSFAYAGAQKAPSGNTIDKQKLNDWQLGNTGYPIVDACMRQLLHTGYMSNRGRQLVASCFVNELNQDWRYGASYFEYQLIDFDVASNWGNWQYLAGVGADPRGHRQFNLEIQTAMYDPNNTFIDHWLT